MPGKSALPIAPQCPTEADVRAHAAPARLVHPGQGAHPARQAGESDWRGEALAAMVEMSPHVVFAKDDQGRYLMSSRAHAAFLGCASESELLGKSAAELDRGNDNRLRAIEAHGSHCPPGATITMTDVLANPDGTARTWRISKRRFRHGAGRSDAVLGIAVDISDLIQARQIEEDLTARSRELAATVRESEAFGYSVSHDLRAPLRAVSGLTAMLLEDHAADLSGEVRLLVESIAQAGATMSAMVDALLALSKSNRMGPRRSVVDLSALAQSVWNEIFLADTGRQVTFRAGQGCSAWADPALARSVLQNLLENAFKFTRGSEPALVEFGSVIADGEVHFFVRDNGAGFDMAGSGRLFEAFQRLHSAREFEGTGIGLATARRIVQLHGGRLWAESAPGKGATFRFTLGQRR